MGADDVYSSVRSRLVDAKKYLYELMGQVNSLRSVAFRRVVDALGSISFDIDVSVADVAGSRLLVFDYDGGSIVPSRFRWSGDTGILEFPYSFVDGSVSVILPDQLKYNPNWVDKVVKGKTVIGSTMGVYLRASIDSGLESDIEDAGYKYFLPDMVTRWQYIGSVDSDTPPISISGDRLYLLLALSGVPLRICCVDSASDVSVKGLFFKNICDSSGYCTDINVQIWLGTYHFEYCVGAGGELYDDINNSRFVVVEMYPPPFDNMELCMMNICVDAHYALTNILWRFGGDAYRGWYKPYVPRDSAPPDWVADELTAFMGAVARMFIERMPIGRIGKSAHVNINYGGDNNG